ncbi:hypothetical protein K6U06_11940 [Acidiferrimicrobium sp. IK]|uniref:glycoside hydrolase family 2 protein n=1 Tax=Acidiferrimicrobium sp. IK TaxID=2871700 RepID=UPI0021CB5259|nr:hypothetical protein [Acidiferrimicrobium sp. IK]MCU4185075.1 hypothetical protein [Acidiferrimicrobium sp. IK]
MDLGGSWRAAPADDLGRRTFPDTDLDDSGWAELPVPGHWRSVPAFCGSDGPLFYRRRFEAPAPPQGRRAWLRFDGVFYQGDVWLDGSYLGDTEGYFFAHTFEVTEALRDRAEHTLAVEVACSPQDDRTAKRNLTGVFQHWDCIDPSWNPGGIWAAVHVEETGPVRIAGLRVLCREASEERAALDIEVELDAAEAASVTLTTVVRDDRGEEAARRVADEAVAAGPNRARWRVALERPKLWWPHAMGGQPLYDVEVAVSLDGGAESAAEGGEPSHSVSVRTGLRQVRMRNFVATVNGERLFLKGANYGPTRRELAEAPANRIAGDIGLAVEAGLDLLRVHGHIGRPELYDAADRAGLLLWQDLPLQWGYANVRRQAVRQAREAVSLLGHHPSIMVWCGHNEPLALDLAPDGALSGRQMARFAVGQALPSWNKTALDRSVRRALEKADASRPVIAHSGVLPHPAGGTDTHLYHGWYQGDVRNLPAVLARLPVLARFVGEFGAQAVPDSDEWLDTTSWPDLDWDHLVRHHGLQKAIFDRRVPPAAYPDFDGWRAATQAYQAEVIRFHVEHLRRLKYRPAGGFCQFLLADAQPGVSWSVLDHRRSPKAGFAALAAACAPVIVVADRPRDAYQPGEKLRLAVHVVSDRRSALPGASVTARLEWPGGGRTWRFGGEVGPDSCVRVGRLEAQLPKTPGPVSLDLRLEWDGGSADNRYTAVIAPR